MKREKTSNITGEYIARYSILYLIVVSVIMALEIYLLIFGLFNYKFTSVKSRLYLTSYIVLLIGAIIAFVIIFLYRKNKLPLKALSICGYTFSVFIIVWAILISSLDVLNSGYPIVFLTIVACIGGIIVLNPIHYVSLSIIGISIISILNSTVTDKSYSGFGDYFNIIVFMLMSFLISYRHYTVSINDSKRNEYLDKLSHTDYLTGLGNETAFFQEVEQIDKYIENGTARFGIVIMDVNNVKANNDKYGHSYGCHLIVTAGKLLPEIFTTSKLFHIGGDEYVAIVLGSDYDNLEEVIEKFDNTLECYDTSRNGIDMKLSVARGYKKYDNEKTFNELFQIVDETMYDNKNYIKSKYNFRIR